MIIWKVYLQMRTNHSLKLALLAVLCLTMIACEEKNNGNGDDVKIVTTYISVPSSLEIEEGANICFTLSSKTNIKASDQIVMRSASNQDYICPIISINDGKSLEFALADGITSGNYKVYVQRDKLNYYIAAIDLTILKPLVIEPDSDTSIYGIVTCDGNGVPGVLVSDGNDIVKTDANGIYQLKSQKKWQYVFIIIPSGYEVPCQGVLPQFHAALSQGANVAERKDFELIKADNDKFTLFVLGDMHLAKRNGDLSQFADLAKTLNSSIAKAGGKSYCLTLGDMTWDLYWYSNSYTFPQYLETANSNFQNVAFFHTMGNHDNDMNEVGDFNKAFRYTRDIAPTFYSFNLGKAHFVVLDNIDYNDVGTGSDLRSKYVLDYTAEQMAWLAKDLAYVDKGTPVFITSHAPVSRPNGASSFNDKYMNGANSAGEANMAEFISSLSAYNVNFISGHTHNLFHRKHSNQFSEHNEGAVCACWWWTGHVTPGIHVSQDGTPGGYGVWQFNGKDFKYSFQAAGHNEKYQFRAYDMNEVKKVVTPEAGGNNSDFTPYASAISAYPSNSILVNVWDYDDSWSVSISENGQELNVTKDYAYDPVHIMAYTAPRYKSNASVSFGTSKWPHFFSARASSPNSTVTVTVTDRNGNKFTETMNRPKAFNLSDYKNQY